MAIDNGRAHLIGLAKAQRWLLALFLAHLAAAIAFQFLPDGSPAYSPLATVLVVSWLLMLAFVGEVTRRLGGWGWAVVVIVLMLIPLVNLLTLLAVNQRAVRRLKEAGFTVGLMGVPKEQLG